MREIKAIVRQERLDDVVHELHAVGELPGITVSTVRGIGRTHGLAGHVGDFFGEVDMAKVEIVVDDALADMVVRAIVAGARSGRPGDGKIFVYSVDRVVRIRTGEENTPAL
jgi:nitrogen regulatory protein PII